VAVRKIRNTINSSITVRRQHKKHSLHAARKMYKRNNDNKESLLIGAQKRAKINCKLARWGRYRKSVRVRGNGVSAINILRF
jgi:hypothetical protein